MPDILEILQKIQSKTNRKIENYAIFFCEQNLDLFEFIFKGISNTNVLIYQKDDSLNQNYTKLLTFLDIKYFSKQKTTDIEDINFTKTGLLSLSLKALDKLFFKIKNSTYCKVVKRFSTFAFNNEELNILTKLILKYRNSKDEVLVIDNIQNASNVDLLFYQKLIASNFLNLCLPNLKIIFLSDKSVIGNWDLNASSNQNYIRITITEDEINELLAENYSHTNIDLKKLRHYFVLCGNSLQLMNTIIQNNTIKADDLNVIEELTKIVHKILKKINDVNALEFAAIIGLSFDLISISRAMTLRLDEIIYQFEEADKKGLLLRHADKYDFEFVDELIRKIIYQDGHNIVESHLKYAKFLMETSPRDHLLIAKHLCAAEHIEDAILQYFSYYLETKITGKPTNGNENLINRIEKRIEENYYYTSCYIELKEILSTNGNGLKFKDVIFSKSDNKLEQFLDYTKTLSVYIGDNTLSKDDYNILADNFAKSYNFFNECDMYYEAIKSLMCNIDIYYYRISDNERLKGTVNLINSIMKKNASNYGLDINLQMQLTRKVSTTLNPELAFAKCKYLYNAIEQKMTNIDEVEYFKFLSDYLGYALYSGHDKELNNEFFENYDLHLNNARLLNYPKYYKAWMNRVIYLIYNNHINKQDLTKIAKKSDHNIKSRMYRFDIAAINILCGNYNEAEEILKSIYKQCQDNLTCFYNYCINANLTAIYILKHDFKLAKEHNNVILNTQYQWEEDFVKIMKRRASLLEKMIEDEIIYTPNSLFNCFSDQDMYLSKTWNFLGKGIIFSELMYYRD